MPECIRCGDDRSRDEMLSLDSWIAPPENPDLVCVRCASVAMKGGPEQMNDDELRAHGVVVDE